MAAITNNVLNELGVSQKPAREKNSNQLGQEEFLRLMTTQLNNQDPMKPMASGEFFSQIAQFSSVAGIQDLQKSFSQVASAMLSSQSLQASGLVGRDILVSDSSASLTGGGAIKGGIDLSDPASSVKIEVHDGSGRLIKRFDLGDHSAGMVRFSWDGLDSARKPVAPGSYTFSATGIVSGHETGLDVMLADRVDSVTINQDGGGVSLNLKDHGKTDLATVKQII